MLTSAEFFESFDAAGFLKLATWTPFGTTTPYTAKVRYRAPSASAFDAAMRIVDHEMHYVTTQLPGIAEDDQVSIDGVGAFRVRQKPEQILDGSVSRAELAKVVL